MRANNVASVATDTALDDTHRTILVTASGKTMTLPAASVARIGQDWTVALGVAGITTIAVQGADVFLTEDDDTEVILDEVGASLTVRCVTTTAWVIV